MKQNNKQSLELPNHQMDVSIRDKIGQMLIVGFEGKQVSKDSEIIEQLAEHALGGVILFDYHLPKKTYDKNIESPEQVRQLNADLQRFNQLLQQKHHRPEHPLWIAVDYEGGTVDRLKSEYGFPKTTAAHTIGQGDEEHAIEAARAMASTLKQAGFNVNFAPVLDVNVNPDNPIMGQLGRCFSEHAETVARFGRIYAQALQEQQILPVFKHFPGHGSSRADSHLGFVDVSDTWQQLELEPYRLLCRDFSQSMIMTAHIVNRQLDASGLPATLSPLMLTDLLRRELAYEGIIITDDMQMKAITDQYGLEESLVLALNAGADMFIFGNQLVDKPQDPKEVIDIIEANLRTGHIKEETIHAAYARIIRCTRP